MKNFSARILIVKFLFLSFPFCMVGQIISYNFNHLGIEDGLNASLIWAIFQDSEGFIWFGSVRGLQRYDGKEIIQFNHNPKDSNSVIGTKVRCITQDLGGFLWIGTELGLSHYDPATKRFSNFIPEKENPNSLLKKWVVDILPDSKGQIWISYVDDGLSIFDPQTKIFAHFSTQFLPGDTTQVNVEKIFEDKDNRIWLATDNGLFLFDPDSHTSQKYFPDSDEKNVGVNCVGQLNEETLWMGTNESLFLFHMEDEYIEKVDFPNFPDPELLNGVYDGEVDKFGILWMATYAGIARYTPWTGEVDRIINDSQHNRSFPHSLLFIDNLGIIWLGGGDFGVDRINPQSAQFSYFPTSQDKLINHIAGLRTFLELEPGKLLVPQKGGLFLLDWKKGVYKPSLIEPKEFLDRWEMGVVCFMKDNQGKLWIGTHGGGIFEYDLEKRKFRNHYFLKSKIGDSFGANQIRQIFQQANGTIWVGTWWHGIFKMDPISKAYTHFLPNPDHPQSLNDPAFRKFFEDRMGNLWIGTRNGGLSKFLPESESFMAYTYQPGVENSLSNPGVFDILEDKEGILWLGTFGGGLNRFDPQKNQFISYTINDGLAGNTVYSLHPQSDSSIWLICDNGLSLFNTYSEHATTFGEEHGLQNRAINAFSPYKSPFTGHMYFEGSKGIEIFHPDSIKTDSSSPKLAFTGLEIADREIDIIPQNDSFVKSSTFYLEKSLNYIDKLKLPYSLNKIVFRFSALHYNAPEKIKYTYLLDGFDSEWQQASPINSATYTNIPPGTYVLKVKAINADGVWSKSELTLPVTITPPWYRTWWAFLLYFLFSGTISFFLYRFLLNRKMVLAETARLEELNNTKNRIFTNISHEFRSPLTAILGVAEELNEYEEAIAREEAQVLKRNGQHLLFLVNQMLDLAKLEGDQITLNWVHGDIIFFIRYIMESFHSQLRLKGIHLTLSNEQDFLEMNYDPERLMYILTNLLSNAIKFTPKNGDIFVHTYRKSLSHTGKFFIEVEDTGSGIPTSQLPFIFDRFYRGEEGLNRRTEGTGIGLAIVKEFSELMGGTVSVESELGKGTRFTLTFPIVKKESVPTQDATPFLDVIPLPISLQYPPINPQPEAIPSYASTILIVEDNPDVANYLSHCLTDTYRLEIAENGIQGKEKAFAIVPDIIISDVMMPIMDGFTLCEELKNDQRVCHIPIVLLTAKSDVPSKILGLNKGADVYLPKPFHKLELLTHIGNLLKQRLRLQRYYLRVLGLSQEEGERSLSIPESTRDDPWLRQVKKLIEENLDHNQNLVPLLCQKLGMNDYTLRRKIKALTGVSTKELIQEIRLKEAKRLLLIFSMNVSEIAYQLGFSDPDYFSKFFKKKTGLSPSAFRKQEK